MAKTTIPQEVKRQVDNFVSVLRKDKLPIEKALIFGSYAKGRQNRFSDIDLCIISPKFKDSLEALQYLWLKRKEIKDSVIEPVGFNPKDFSENSSLVGEIKRTGTEIEV